MSISDEEPWLGSGSTYTEEPHHSCVLVVNEMCSLLPQLWGVFLNLLSVNIFSCEDIKNILKFREAGKEYLQIISQS